MLGRKYLFAIALACIGSVAACYQPEVRDCVVHCSQPGDCTGGQVCNADGFCAMPGVKDCPKSGDGDHGDTPIDAAAVTHDTGPADLCPLGCPKGTCQNGVCVIDCGTPDSCTEQDVQCPPNIPCRVVCGDHSCAKKVNCGQATSCEVQCTGDYSCGDVIQCNDNKCSVTCSGLSSCKRHTDCSHSCACDVTCSGTGSCMEASACPAMSCKLGNGCSSQLAGCDRC